MLTDPGLLITASYASAMLAYLLLAVLLATAWRGRLEGGLLTLSVIVSVIWSGLAALLAHQGTDQTSLYLATMIAEIVRDVCWLLFLMRLLGDVGGGKRSSWLVLILGLVAIVSAIVSLSEGDGFQGHARTTLMFVLLFLAVVGLMKVELVYRRMPADKRHLVKFLCCALGALFAYDFFLYSEGLLYEHIDYSLWGARGIVNALVVPLIAVTAARNPQWSVDIFVSRSVIFHSTAVIGAGLYLLAMAAGGYYIRHYGGDWGAIAQAAFMFAAALLLLIVMLSDRFRARVRVFFNKHFYSYKYDYRREWLRFTQALAAEGDGEIIYQRLIKAMAAIGESTGGVLWVDDGGGALVLRAREGGSRDNIDDRLEDLASNGSLAGFLEQSGWLVDINDYRRQPNSYPDLVLPDFLLASQRYWLVIPLIYQQKLLAILVLNQPTTRHSIDWEDCDVLKTAALQAAVHLAQYESSQALSDARQFEAFNQLSAFIIHDLKNLIAQLSLLLQNAERHADDPEFVKDMLITVDNSVERMNRLLARLRSGRHPQETASVVELSRLLEKVIADKASSRPSPQAGRLLKGVTVLADPERLQMVIGHIVQNAIDASPADGTIEIDMSQQGDDVLLEVSDCGCGMSRDFIRDHLFRPFVSTKGEGNMGVGVYEARQFLRQMGGDIEVQSTVGKGTRFTMRMPLHARINHERPH